LHEHNVAHDQGLVVASCLLSGLEVFHHNYSGPARWLRVLRGFHGLHSYASEYWIDYLLFTAASENGLDTRSKFFARSVELSRKLNALRRFEGSISEPNATDSRLAHLEGHPDLLIAARTILAERAPNDDRDGTFSPPDISTASIYEVTDLATLLSNYQCTIQELLQLWKFEGISIQELGRFKQDFRSAAFTCPYPDCPFSNIGFEAKELRDRHIQSHASRIHCDFTGCSYPALPSIQALKKHKAKDHSQSMSSTRIKIPQSFVRRKDAAPGPPGDDPGRILPRASDAAINGEKLISEMSWPTTRLATRCSNR